jgi:hypothetical protein
MDVLLPSNPIPNLRQAGGLLRTFNLTLKPGTGFALTDNHASMAQFRANAPPSVALEFVTNCGYSLDDRSIVVEYRDRLRAMIPIPSSVSSSCPETCPDRGGRRAARMFSLIVTGKMSGVDPQAWLGECPSTSPPIRLIS